LSTPCAAAAAALPPLTPQVLSRCTLTADNKVCAVDKGKYKRGNLRLPLARKREGAQPMLPRRGEALDFEHCMVNVVGPQEHEAVNMGHADEAAVTSEFDDGEVRARASGR